MISKTLSVEATQKVAENLVKKILEAGPRNGAVVLGLVGDLGAGKTTFAQGFARALGVKEKITSPTFLIVKSYKLEVISFKNFYHIDAYRLNSPQELLDLGLADLIKNPQNIILIEWADKVMGILPKNSIFIDFSHGEKDEERTIAPRLPAS